MAPPVENETMVQLRKEHGYLRRDHRELEKAVHEVDSRSQVLERAHIDHERVCAERWQVNAESHKAFLKRLNWHTLIVVTALATIAWGLYMKLQDTMITQAFE